MSDKITTGPGQSIGFDERLEDLPVFVRRIEPRSEPDFDVGNLNCWSPERSGLPSLDYDRGRRHALAAIEYSRHHGAPVFLLFVLMTMRGRPIEAMERGFIETVVARALSGAAPSPIDDQTMEGIAGIDIPPFREIEHFMGCVLRAARAHQHDILQPVTRYIIELLDGVHGEWIGGGIFMLAGAAMNGRLH